MTTEELTQKISKKGAVAKTSFNTWLGVLMDSYIPDDEETLAIMSYNMTILLMEKIRDYPVFFQKKCHISERSRNRMLKDLETMTLLNYPDGSDNHDYEKYIVDSLPIIKDELNEGNH